MMGLLAAILGLVAAAGVGFGLWARGRAGQLASQLEHARRSLQRLQLSFNRFVPSMVVEEIIDEGVSKRAEKKEVTVLFADLQGFTRMSEALDPSTLVEVLNGYFERMSAAIRDHHGHVSKFMGDGLMALFGALETNPWQAKDAVDAALRMREVLAAYNVELKEKGLPELVFGIGIHKGTVVAGLVGSQALMEFTVIGDVVNVAARVESLTRAQKVDVLITEDIERELKGRFVLEEQPPCVVKGKTEPLRTFAVKAQVRQTSRSAPAVSAG